VKGLLKSFRFPPPRNPTTASDKRTPLACSMR